jgi:hypothetical protein
MQNPRYRAGSGNARRSRLLYFDALYGPGLTQVQESKQKCQNLNESNQNRRAKVSSRSVFRFIALFQIKHVPFAGKPFIIHLSQIELFPLGGTAI